MGSLEILKAGLMTSIQDFGRKGLAYYAIPKSGVMDGNAAKIALLLLNKRDQSALIECTSMAPTIKFHSDITIAISGADFQWKLNDNSISSNTKLDILKGDILKGGFSKKSMRGYIAINAELVVDKIFDSYSTYTPAKLGGYQGRLLKKGDVIKWLDRKESNIDLELLFYKGPEYDWLTEIGKSTLLKSSFQISRDTDRMGMRLEGEVIACANYQLPASSPVLPGFIQLPPSGLPIIVLQDSQTTGGYPRIGYLREEELYDLNQRPLGETIRFKLAE